MSSSRRSPRHTSPSPEICASPCISTAAAARSSAAARIAAVGHVERYEELIVRGGGVCDAPPPPNAPLLLGTFVRVCVCAR
eukprot:355958-Prymnesium_polylepis.1